MSIAPELPRGAGPPSGEPGPVRILVVDDELSIAELVRTALSLEGWEVDVSTRGDMALAAARCHTPDAVVLDLMLPDIAGLEVMRRLRHDMPGLPIVILTARDDVEDRLAALAAGADHYVTKPFRLEDLIARIRSLLRGPAKRDGGTSGLLRVGDLALDEDAHDVWRACVPIRLTATEFELLRYLMRHSGRVRSRTQILEHVWGFDSRADMSLLELYMSYLREKIDTGREPMIHTIRGAGYMVKPAS